MELRDLEYFVAIAREGSITGAAAALHLSQPALTRQLKALEDEMQTQLVIRGNRRIQLTEEGMILRRRAEDILHLADRTKEEVMHSEDSLSGDIYICAGETEGLHYLTQAAKRLLDRHPNIRFHISSGDTDDVTEELEKGLIDFGLLFDPIDATKYEHVPIPFADTWGVLARKDSPLGARKTIAREELVQQPLIIPRRPGYDAIARQFFDTTPDRLRIVGTYSLIFNASLMVHDGIGCAITLDKILNLTGDSALCFIPFEPRIDAHMNVVWRRYQVLSKTAAAFLRELRQEP